LGDILAILLLLAILAGLGWLWWLQGHPKTRSAAKPPSEPPLVKKTEVHQVIPTFVRVEPPLQPPPEPPLERLPAPPPTNVLAPFNLVAPPVISTPTPVVTNVPEGPVMAFKPPVIAEFPRPTRDLLEAQIALARRAISPGCIDGAMGSQTRAALAVFQETQDLAPTHAFDPNTQRELTMDEPALTTYSVSSSDLARLQPLGKTWLAKSRQSALEYENILQLVAEKAHAHPALIRKLNPGIDWAAVPVGTVLKIPAVTYPDPTDRAALVVIHLADRYLEAFDTESNLLVHFPCSIAAKVDKRPVGRLHVAVVAAHPNYTFDPEIFAESAEARAIGHKLTLPPGPKNPVGVAWIGLDKPGYGIHGTPSRSGARNRTGASGWLIGMPSTCSSWSGLACRWTWSRRMRGTRCMT
jgi:lipoprotein-anchoring transpeptidase ErfK/SrfK